MNLHYQYDETLLKIEESPNEGDIEFTLTILNEDFKKRLVEIRNYFNMNNILTDVHVYIHPNNRYQIIVRKDYRNEFLLQLFKQQLLRELKWV